MYGLNAAYMARETFSETPRRSMHVKYINKFKGSELGVVMFSALPALFKDCVPANQPHWFVLYANYTGNKYVSTLIIPFCFQEKSKEMPCHFCFLVQSVLLRSNHV